MTPANPPAADLDHVLARTAGLWEELRGQRLFITGGTGFFGRWLIESFARANDRLGLDARAVVLSRDPAAFARKAPHLAAHPALQFVPGDVSRFAFPAGRFGYVIHAATDASAKLIGDAPLTMFDTIVAGTRRVLDFAQAAGTRRVLFTSSGAVYGRQPADVPNVPEDYPGAPDPTDSRSCYGEGKRAAELLGCLAAGRHGFEFTIARCFAFVGPFLPLDAHFAVGNFIRDALAGGPIRVNGDGTPYRSYLYAADLAVWLWTILFRGRSCRPYNVGSGEAVSVKETAETVARCLQRRRPEVTVAQPPVPGRPAERYVPDVRRAAEELGLSVAIPLVDAVARTIRWHAPAGGPGPAS
jgi:nucleoside-diphosphate-sugar epimerase